MPRKKKKKKRVSIPESEKKRIVTYSLTHTLDETVAEFKCSKSNIHAWRRVYGSEGLPTRTATSKQPQVWKYCPRCGERLK